MVGKYPIVRPSPRQTEVFHDGSDPEVYGFDQNLSKFR